MDSHAKQGVFIQDFFHHIGVDTLEKLDRDFIASALGVTLEYASVSFIWGNHIILRSSTLEEEWELFGCAVGQWIKKNMFFISDMAGLFDDRLFYFHFCAPLFFMKEVQTQAYERSIHQIQETFNVSRTFAEKRLSMVI